MKVSYSIPIKPHPKGRPRFGAGHAYTPSDTVEYEKAVATHIKALGARPRPNPCIVDMSFYWKRPKSVGLEQFFTKRPDWDNIGKALSDALNGVCWNDDSQIVQCTVSKDYGEEDRVDLEITYL